MKIFSRKRYIFLAALFILLTSVACQTVTQYFNETANDPVLDEIDPLPTDTVIDRAKAEPDSVAEAVPTYEYESSAWDTHGLSAKKQQHLFDELWEIVNDEYLYPDFNGLDWAGVHDEYSAYIARGLSDQEFYFRMWEVIIRLGDDHSVFLDPYMLEEEEALYAGDLEYVGLGVITTYLPDPGIMTIEIIFPDSSAERAGLKPHDNILTMNGQSMAELYDEELGTVPPLQEIAKRNEAEFTIQTPGEEPRTMTLAFEKTNVLFPVPAQVFTSPDGQRIGYITLTTFTDPGIPEEFARQLRALGPLDGLILDNRINTGGYNTVAESVLSYFIEGEVGSFVSRNEARSLYIDPLEIYDSQNIPLVVLVGEGTMSFGEIFSGILKDQDRAFLIGNTTFGNIETLWGFELPYDTYIWLAHETFAPYHHSQEDWEQTGIVPHLEVDAPWHLYTPETDPAIQAALDYFDQ